MSARSLIVDGTLDYLIDRYMADPKSPFQRVSAESRENCLSLCRRLKRECGSVFLGLVGEADLIQWRDGWKERGPYQAGALMLQLRSLFLFGKQELKDHECGRLVAAIYSIRASTERRQGQLMTAEQVVSLRAAANRRGRLSIALAQALQFEGKLTQKQVIGEWVPKTDSGVSDIIHKERKWLPGLCWSNLDEALFLSVGEAKIDLKLLPMVMEELSHFGKPLPKNGPMIVRDGAGRPYFKKEYRTEWRAAADAAGIPRRVRSMDSRPRAPRMSEVIDENRKLRTALLLANAALEGSESERAKARGQIRQVLDSLHEWPIKTTPWGGTAGKERQSSWRQH